VAQIRLKHMEKVMKSKLIMRQTEFFRHTPILENRAFFLSSSCSYCGFIILAGSEQELLQEKEGHAMECKARLGPRRLAIRRMQ
jgi:hypothetical protein